MSAARRHPPGRRRRPWLDILAFGAASGILIAVLQLTQLRFLVVDHSVEIFTAVVAVVFVAVGLWLGRTLRRPEVVVVEQTVESLPFEVDRERQEELGITARELEILELISEGLSNRQIGERLCISENTVKTHSSRLFDKLGARRRTQAVRIGRSQSLVR